jgi:geranylgeranyl diphosphate synthase type I
MNAKEYLGNYKKELEPLLKNYFKNRKESFRKIDRLSEEAIEILERFTMAGGKRVRPAMVYYGYLLAGGRVDGQRKVNILEASMAIELVHSFLLIHDDIIDRDAKRRGEDTVHEQYRKISEKFFPKADHQHFGVSMGLIAGDLAASMANEILFESKFSANIIIDALKQLQKIVYITIPGEMLDVVMEAKGEATEEEILKMHEGKTAFYTFEGPLHLGATLAGNKSPKLLKKLSSYSMAVGKAFQIRDDILGVFGDEKKLGKPIGSDIIENKQTLLALKALKKGDKKQREVVKKLLGKKDLTLEELEDFRRVVRETGSLDYSNKLANQFIEEGFKVLGEMEILNKEGEDFLREVAKYVSIRNH